MDGSLVIMGGSQFFDIFVIPMDGGLVIMGGSLFFDIFVTPMDGSLVIMECSLLSRFLLLQWMVALSLWKVVCCRDFCYTNGCSLVIIEGSLLSI